MPVINRIAALAPEIAEWRRDIHAHPELLFDVHRTGGSSPTSCAASAATRWSTGIGRTGVVGVIRGRATGSGRVIGLRADMDALPMTEATGLPYASQHRPARCTPAATTATPRCCSAPRSTSPRPATSTAPRW